MEPIPDWAEPEESNRKGELTTEQAAHLRGRLRSATAYPIGWAALCGLAGVGALAAAFYDRAMSGAAIPALVVGAIVIVLIVVRFGGIRGALSAGRVEAIRGVVTGAFAGFRLSPGGEVAVAIDRRRYKMFAPSSGARFALEAALEDLAESHTPVVAYVVPRGRVIVSIEADAAAPAPNVTTKPMRSVRNRIGLGYGVMALLLGACGFCTFPLGLLATHTTHVHCDARECEIAHASLVYTRRQTLARADLHGARIDFDRTQTPPWERVELDIAGGPRRITDWTSAQRNAYQRSVARIDAAAPGTAPIDESFREQEDDYLWPPVAAGLGALGLLWSGIRLLRRRKRPAQ